MNFSDITDYVSITATDKAKTDLASGVGSLLDKWGLGFLTQSKKKDPVEWFKDPKVLMILGGSAAALVVLIMVMKNKK